MNIKFTGVLKPVSGCWDGGGEAAHPLTADEGVGGQKGPRPGGHKGARASSQRGWGPWGEGARRLHLSPGIQEE